MYQIQRNDNINGSSYSVIIKKDDLDKNALYTIMYEKPDFLVPVSYRAVSDSIELSYNVGNLILMKYLSRERKVDELPFMWRNIILPLDECRDYFMNPLSMVLNMEYMFCDNRNSNKIKYIYIPTKSAMCQVEDLKQMITEVLEDNPFLDAKIENSVLRGLQNFSLSGFVGIINSWELSEPKNDGSNDKIEDAIENPISPIPNEVNQEDIEAPLKEKKLSFSIKNNKKKMDNPINKENKEEVKSSLNLDMDDMFGEKIHLNLEGKNKVKEKKEKEKREKKSFGLFGKKKAVISAKEISEAKIEPVQNLSVPDNYAVNLKNASGNASTELLEMSSARLIYKGVKNHPGQIDIDMENGETFMIGRVDKHDTSSRKDFEFPIETKAVSRKHCVIIKKDEAYYIDDLNSKAGTYVDGKRVMPNHPVRLYSGSQISFGSLGADYIWEENNDEA